MVSLPVPVLPPASLLVVLLIVGMPAYRALFPPAAIHCRDKTMRSALDAKIQTRPRRGSLTMPAGARRGLV